MNVMLLSLLYPRETMAQVAANVKDKIQHQINSYQHAFVRGIDENLLPGERLDIINALPVGVFPICYRKPWLKGGLRDGRIRELSALNLPWIKQRQRERNAARALLAWAKEAPENRTVLLYTLYLPYMRAIERVKKAYPDMRAAVIVTDLPNDWGISSGRRGLLKCAEYAMGDQRLKLCGAFDGFVLLTEHMGEVLPVAGKPSMVMEGLILNEEPPAIAPEAEALDARPAVLYSGTLNRELGIAELLEAFAGLPQYQLWLCGTGDMDQEARAFADRCENIRYFGFVPHDKALSLQARATLLVNPRSPRGVFTRYSFPSKTMEYMRSGKPVLCYRLEGIPAEYDQYLFYIDQEGAQGIRSAVCQTLSLSERSLAKRGLAGQTYVREQKNPKVQCRRLVRFLRGLA